MRTLLLFLICVSAANAVLVNRYSFNGNCNDSVGTRNGTLVNITGNSTYGGESGGMLVLGNTGVERTSGDIGRDPNDPNTPTPWPLGDYVDLPNGTLYNAVTTGQADSFSIEMWVKIDAQQETEVSLFDFGQSYYFDETVYTQGIGEVAPNQAYPYVADEFYGTTFIFENNRAKRTYFSPFAPYAAPDPNSDNPRWRWLGQFHNYDYPGIFTNQQWITIPTTGTVHIVCSYKLDKRNTVDNTKWLLYAALYVNGQLAGTQTYNGVACDFSIWPDASGGDTGVDLNCWLGRSQQRYAKYLQGGYDEVRIYNHALSPSEAAYNYTVGPDYYCDSRNQSDINGDCFVNAGDFQSVYTSWLNQSPRKSVKDSLIHRWKFNGDLTDSVGTADGTLVSELPAQYTFGLDYFELVHPFSYLSNDLLDSTQPTKGSFVQLPNGILTGHPNVTIEMFVTENEWRWDAQHFNFGANDQYWTKTSSWKKREAVGSSSQDSGCNPFFKFQSYLEETPQESMQCWWHQGDGHWGQNIYVRPPLTTESNKVNVTHVAMTVENDVPGIWNWTQNRPTQPGDNPGDSFAAGDRITFYSNGQVAMGGSYSAPTPQIKILPLHEGPNFQDPYVWDDTRGGTVTPNGYLEEGEAKGWKETANYIGRNGFKGNLPNARYYDFRIYDRALTAAELAQSFTNGSEAEICSVPGDIDGSCSVDMGDFVILAREWLLDTITY